MEVFTELKVRPNFIVNGEDVSIGTGDVIILDNDTLEVIDYKNGREHVNEVSNMQMITYAIGALWELNNGILAEYNRPINKVVTTIIQPNSVEPGPRVRSYQYDMLKIEEWDRFLKDVVINAMSDNPPIRPGEYQCKWCKSRFTCPQLSTHVSDIVKLEQKAEDMQKETIINVLKNKKLIVSWLKSIDEFAQKQAVQGKKFDGFKLVQAKTNTKWKGDDESLKKELRKLKKEDGKKLTLKDITVQKLIGIGDAKKLKSILDESSWEKLQTLFFKPEGDPVLAPESDKRREYCRAKTVFQPVTQTEPTDELPECLQ